MILPTKRIGPGRSLLNIGASTLKILNRPKSISLLWEDYKKEHQTENKTCYVTYDWFILSLDLLFLLGAIKIKSGRITRANDK